MISIITPTYDRAATLPRAIDSVFGQTTTDWELVIVDDGSQDETLQVLARYDDPRLHVVRHAVNRGVTAARNTGLDAITGEWFTMLDSDDELVPEALEVLADTATRTGAEAITCNCADSQTDAMTGHGWDEEGWKRLDERLPGLEGVLWSKITVRAGRRYYLHRALRIYHTEGEQRVTRQARGRSLAEQCRIDLILADDGAYVEALAVLNPEKRRRLLRRGRSARLLLGSRVLSIPGVRDPRRRHFYALVAAVGFVLAVGSAFVVRHSTAGR